MADTRDAIKAGLLSATAKKGWSATPDKRICPTCESLNGQEVPMDKDFPGGLDAPPQHTRCRCSVVIVVEAANP
jgi:SPP1 gp7 family putative phage head morphogenesis protein